MSNTCWNRWFITSSIGRQRFSLASAIFSWAAAMSSCTFLPLVSSVAMTAPRTFTVTSCSFVPRNALTSDAGSPALTQAIGFSASFTSDSARGSSASSVSVCVSASQHSSTFACAAAPFIPLNTAPHPTFCRRCRTASLWTSSLCHQRQTVSASERGRLWVCRSDRTCGTNTGQQVADCRSVFVGRGPNGGQSATSVPLGRTRPCLTRPSVGSSAPCVPTQ